MSIHFYSYRHKYRCAHSPQMGKIRNLLGNMEAQTETVQLTYILMSNSVGMGLAPIRPRRCVVGNRMGASPIPTRTIWDTFSLTGKNF